MYNALLSLYGGFPGGTSGKEPAHQFRRHNRHGFNPWVRENPWRRAWQSTPVFLPGEFHGNFPSLHGKQKGKSRSSDRFYFLGLQNYCWQWLQHKIKRRFLLGRTAMTNLDSILKSRNVTFPDKGLYSQSYGFSNSHVWMWELDHKEGWAKKNLCFWNMALEKILESQLDSKEIRPVNPGGNQPWMFIGRTDAHTESPILWPPGAKSWFTGKDPDIGKDWRQIEKGPAKDETVSITDSMDESEQTLGDSEGQGSLVCCSPWGWQRVRQDLRTEQQKEDK